MTVQTGFKSIITRVLNAQVEPINFADNINAAKNINNFVANSTNNMIPQVIDPNSLYPRTNMILVNCIYFKGIWETQFPKNQTYRGSFFIDNKNTIQVDYMNVKAKFKVGYFDDFDGFQTLSLPYKNSGMTMLLVLPQNITGLPNLISKMSSFDWTKIEDMMYSMTVNVIMPKFNITFDSKIQNNLKKVSNLD